MLSAAMQSTPTARTWSSARARSAACSPRIHICRPIAARRAPLVAAAAADPSSGPAASPFASANVHRKVGGEPSSSTLELSVASVDACLDEVRPYLIADGGDVEVVSASNGRVELKLRGACSSCASSDATMRMGLERAIKARFGPDVEVAQVSAGGEEGGNSSSGPARATAEAVDGHLNILRNAVASLGGKVRVAEVATIEGGDNAGRQRATVWYKGPRSIGNGIKAAVLERFPGDVVEVDMVDFPPGKEE
jgi:Fe-S cluster biogenesis protein NfuA